MQNLTEKNPLPFWRLKTFNEKLNATIGFLKLYWKPLLKANLLIAGPLFVIGVGLIVYYFNIVFQNILTTPDDPNASLFLGLFFSLFVGGIFYGLALLAITLVTLQVIKTQQGQPDKLNDLGYLFKQSRKRFLKLLGFTILAVAAYLIVSIIVQIVSLLVIFLGPFGVLLVFPLSVFGQLLVFVHMYVIIPTAFYERMGASKTINKGIELVKGRFWQTTGMYFGTKAIQFIIINGMIAPIVSAIFVWLIYNQQLNDDEMFLLSESRRYFFLVIMFLTFIYLFFNLFTNIFHVITGAVQYFTLREEKENSHIYQQIEAFETL